MPYRRNILPYESYCGAAHPWHVTLATHNRKPFLTDPAIAEMVIKSFTFETFRHQGNFAAYCLMPDHIHAVFTSGDANMHDMVRRIKSFTTRQYQKLGGESRMWQPSHYDHGVHVDEDIDRLIAYVLDNPVRKGLVETWEAWPWSGGSVTEPET